MVLVDLHCNGGSRLWKKEEKGIIPLQTMKLSVMPRDSILRKLTTIKVELSAIDKHLLFRI
jgi:hypothetical protein